ncbi:hypothetical protein CMI37_03970 [Candidatus Pacearchaeota archaeon]|nr:hypothetical protein [Candidatus Pacearchaeota archaeon]|tara:strand:+ start:620 stop:1030 length:411 start_codon:yes stop_codon:yes gene_type:complete
MEINGSINEGTIEIDVDVDDIREHLEIMDRDDVENIVSDYIDNRDWSGETEGSIESLLDQYDANSAPCGVGRSFEKAVWWAMGRRTDNDANYVVVDGGPSHITPEGLRNLIREELKVLFTVIASDTTQRLSERQGV